MAVSNHDFSWNINYFFRLMKEVDYYVDSPPIFWEHASWCLRIWPNGVSCATSRCMFLGLLRQDAQNEHQIRCMLLKLRIMRHDGSVLKEIGLIHVFNDQDRFCGGFLESIDRATAEAEQRPPNFFVTFSCIMKRYETTYCAGGISSRCHEIVLPEMNLTLESDNNFRWDIPSFSALPEGRRYSIKSPIFDWENAIWCLRLYPNGAADCRPRWVSLELVRVQPRCEDDSHQVRVVFRIMTSSGGVLKEVGVSKLFKKHDNICEGVLESFTRYSLETDQSPPDSDVSFLCALEYSGTNDSAEGTSQSRELKEMKTILRATSDNDFRWDIPNFRTLPNYLGYFIKSDNFAWENFEWCLRLYPNGDYVTKPKWMILELVKMRPRNVYDSRPVKVIFRIMTSSDSVRKEIGVSTLFKKHTHTCQGVLESVDRSSAETDQRPPDSVVSFSCTLEYCGTTDSVEETSQSREPKQIKTILRATSDNNFKWDIPNFSALPKELGYFLKSRTFDWENATWHLRLYPNGELADSPTCMFLELVRERSRNEGEINQVCVIFRILRRDGSVLKETGERKVFGKSSSNYCRGLLEFVYRSTAEMEKRPRTSGVSFSCTLESFS